MVCVVFEDVLVKIVVKILVGCLGKLEDIVEGVLFLIWDEFSFIIGLMLLINGG